MPSSRPLINKVGCAERLFHPPILFRSAILELPKGENQQPSEEDEINQIEHTRLSSSNERINVSIFEQSRQELEACGSPVQNLEG